MSDSDCIVYGNILERISSAGVLIHNGKNNLVENNIFVDCGSTVRLQDWIATLPYWNAHAGMIGIGR